MSRNKFVGYSTIGKYGPPYREVDEELVKRDLLNTLHTKRGERPMRPNYGTNIHLYLFDPFEDTIRQIIIDEIEEVLDGEPRVSLISMDVEDSIHGIQVNVNLMYNLTMTPMELATTFDRNNREQ